jgi:hypothetical protein
MSDEQSRAGGANQGRRTRMRCAPNRFGLFGMNCSCLIGTPRRSAGDTRSMPHDVTHSMMERFISRGGISPVIGSYDEVAAKFKLLSGAGLDGMAIVVVNHVQEMPIIQNAMLPRLGLRQAAITQALPAKYPCD